MIKYIITGATSFIGINFIKELIKEDNYIYAIIRPESEKKCLLPISDKIKIVELDMCKYNTIHTLIPEPCDIYCSFAWNGTRGSDRDNSKLQELNLIHSLEALTSVLKLKIKKVISAGSQAEYGLCTNKTDENHIENPITEYGKSKLKFYKQACEICKKQNISFKEPRFFSLYGKGDFDGTMIISILKKMLKNESCDLTECTQIWDFMHIKDAVKALMLLCTKDCVDGVYNFGSGYARELKYFIDCMHELSQSKSILNFGEIPYPSTGIVNVYPDIQKLQTELNFNPNISFDQGILEIIEI